MLFKVLSFQMRRLFYRILGAFIFKSVPKLTLRGTKRVLQYTKTDDSHAARQISRAEKFQLFF
jgi:hypothetical protein